MGRLRGIGGNDSIHDALVWGKNTVESGGRGPVLVVAGSVSPVTARQMNRFLSQKNVRPASLRAEALVHDEAAEVRRCAQEASGWLRSGQDVLLASAVDGGCRGQCPVSWSHAGDRQPRVSEIVAAAMGQVVTQLISLQLAGTVSDRRGYGRIGVSGPGCKCH